MGSRGFIHLLFEMLVMATFLFGFSQAYQFYVGGKRGWVVDPAEKYNKWAERMRFQVNDTLYFKYEKGSDSVLVVSKNDYYSCNTTNPIHTLTGGNSIFQFTRSGPFFFITGNADHCNRGQKLIVVVLAVRHRKTPPPLAPSPTASPPSVTSPPPLPLAPADSPADFQPNSDGPVPAAHPGTKSGAMTSAGSIGLAVWGVSVILGSFVGMV